MFFCQGKQFLFQGRRALQRLSMRLLPMLLDHPRKFTATLLQAISVKQMEVSFCQRDSFLVYIGSNNLSNVFPVQISQDAKMIRRSTAGIVQDTWSSIPIDRCAMCHASLKYFARQPHRKRWMPRQTIKYPSAGEIGIVQLFCCMLVLHRLVLQESGLGLLHTNLNPMMVR